MKTNNAVFVLKKAFRKGDTFHSVDDVRTFLTTGGFRVSATTAARFDTVARNELAHEGFAVQDPTYENNWTRTMVASDAEIAKSRNRSIRYLKTFSKNLAARINVDASMGSPSPEVVANQALLREVTKFTQVMMEYEASQP